MTEAEGIVALCTQVQELIKIVRDIHAEQEELQKQAAEHEAAIAELRHKISYLSTY